MATKRADGRWTATRTVAGKRIYGYGRSEREAELDLESKIAEISAPPIPSTDTLSGFAQSVWWPRQRTRCSVLTLKRYRGALANHIEPVFGGRRLDAITSIDCQEFASSLARSGLAPKTVSIVVSVFSAVLRHAVRVGAIGRNPCDGVALPKRPPKRERSLTLAELRELLAASEAIPRLGIRVFLAAVLGLRRGEIAGLRWEDLDRQAGRLHIRRQIVDIKAGIGQRELPPKGGKTRVIPLTDWMVSEIDRLGDIDSPRIAGGGGPDLITKQWESRRKKLGLEGWSFHDLRHCAASTLNALGVDLVTIAAILGHSRIDMTLLYANTVEGSARKAADILSKTLDGCLPDVVKPEI